MKTLLLPATDENIEKAAALIREGEIVAAPTETVYGIFASSYNGEAVAKVFKAKGRPMDNPLISHISNIDMMMDGLVSEFNEKAQKLAAAFWPGPFTMILPRGEKVCDEICAGLNTVGVRMPSNPAAHLLIEKAGVPLGAPSANISGRPSPTNAKDTFADLDGRLPMVLDGGACDFGVESTVISMVGEPMILRPGCVTKEQIEAVLGEPVALAPSITEKLKEGEIVRSPGMKYKHYAPKAEVIILDGSFEQYCSYVKEHMAEGTWCLCFDGEQGLCPAPALCYGHEADGLEQAHALFNALRRLDDQGAKTVYARCPRMTGVSLAVYNRLIRAAAFRKITL